MIWPQTLAAQLPASWDRLLALVGRQTTGELQQALERRGLLQEVERLMALSPFFTEQLARNAAWVGDAVDGDWLESRDWQVADWDSAVSHFTRGAEGDDAYMTALRCFRSREMLRLLWRDFSGRGQLGDTLSDVTELADCVIRDALTRATEQLRPRFGMPIGAESGHPQALIILGMGKLGGGELNLSSDIDLIFTYPESGTTINGRSQISNQEFFIKAGQSVIRYLDAPTADGFVFRVDMRLRPYGDSGPLVCNFDSLELYYQEQGRDWERYALMKARPITGALAAKEDLSALLSAFVYRRYTDFGVIDSLRDMKAMIMSEVRRLDLSDDIKKGEGGIREVEFITQCLQLIHGGRTSQLQVRSTVLALKRLKAEALLEPSLADDLLDAYQWLRNCEHALQGLNDKQTQTLPVDDLSRARVAEILSLSSWTEFLAVLNGHRHAVTETFVALIAPAQESSTPHEASDAPALLAFNDVDEAGLTTLGFLEPAKTFAAIEAFVGSTRTQMISGEGRRRLERFLPRLVEAAGSSAHPDDAIERLLPFVAAVSRRSAYLVLLEENPGALNQLVNLAIKSPWVARKLSQRPDLLDELLDSDRLNTAPDRNAIGSIVRQQLLRIPEEDLEQQMLALGRIKDSMVLRVAASELAGSLPIMKVSDYLTFLAEILLHQAIAVAKAELVSRHGQPQGEQASFAVLGFGKLGGLELSYASDLDVVFVYAGGEGETAGPKVIDNVRFYTRLAQRVVHVLSTQMASGRLYEVDLRLRPHGESGLVAVSLNGFHHYQLESAWTWEHQALIRARGVAGDAPLLQQLAMLRSDILRKPRDAEHLAHEVVAMRQRMIDQSSHQAALPEGYFDLKRDPGGIVDIEFVVQYAVLAYGHSNPAVTKWSDVVRILESLELEKVMPSTHVASLRSAYLDYRSAVHSTALADGKAVASRQHFAEHRAAVIAIRDIWLPGIVTTTTD